MFASFSRHRAVYDQMRVLDDTGMERIRVDYRGGEAVVVPTSQLQNKKGRYYFDDAFSLAPGSLFMSVSMITWPSPCARRTWPARLRRPMR